MNSYNRNDIAQLAAQTHFLRDNLEKVLRLSDVLNFIAQSPKLKDCLVLKGGTAINLTVFAMPRLSVDIDLDFYKDCTRDEMLAYRAEINAEIMAYMDSQGYQSVLIPKIRIRWIRGYSIISTQEVTRIISKLRSTIPCGSMS